MRFLRLCHFLRLAAGLLLASAFTASAADVTEVLAPGTELSFEAAADGTPAPTFEWYRNGTKVGEGAKLVVGPLTEATAGSYTVKATNPLGAATSDKYTVAIGSPPTKPTILLVVSVTVTATVGAEASPSNAARVAPAARASRK
jgi:hypothetical protein